MVGMIDVHCHILPGVDDGASTMREALRMLKMEYAQGVRKVILTPHLRIGMFETPADEILQRYVQLSKETARLLPDMELHLGCEFHSTSRMTAVLQKEDCRRMSGTKYVLIEFAGKDDTQDIVSRVNNLLHHGYRPIIAHAERYPCLHASFNTLQELCEMGAYIQLNAASVMGDEGREVRGFCKKALKYGCVHLIATDAHDMDMRMPNLGQCAAYLEKKIGLSGAREILTDNPERLLTNEYI